MPLLRSSPRPQAVECFFCLSASVLPPLPNFQPSYNDRKGKGKAIAEVGTKWNWKCERCGCWNIRDERGEMRSDLPAMHDPAFNTRSFALRATPSTSHLPSASRNAAKMFCHSCLANQTLIMNMLANYLPDDNDPSYPQLFASLPSYVASLHGRYPPVCPICQPAVDEALRKADQKAQVEAWGFALRRGQASSGDDSVGSGTSWAEVLIWRLRGIGFWTSTLVDLAVGLCSLVCPGRALEIVHQRPIIANGLLTIHLSSILWLGWDPHWLRRQRSQRRAPVKGRSIWLWSMLLLFMSQLMTSNLIFWSQLQSFLNLVWTIRAIFAVEIIALIVAYSSLRSPKPIELRLIRPTQLSPPSTPIDQQHGTSTSYHRHFADSPSNAHTSSVQYNPVFGKSSLNPRSAHSKSGDNDMEWEPTPPPVLYNGGYTSTGPVSSSTEPQTVGGGGDWDNFAQGKQRMFGQKEGEDETGLESLLAGWGLTEQVGNHAGGNDQGGWRLGALKWLKSGKGRD